MSCILLGVDFYQSVGSGLAKMRINSRYTFLEYTIKKLFPDTNDLDCFMEELAQINEWAYAQRYREPIEAQQITGKIKTDSGRYPGDIHALLKQLQCISYQCCDWSGWERSTACRRVEELIRAIKDEIINQIPEYQAAPWSEVIA